MFDSPKRDDPSPLIDPDGQATHSRWSDLARMPPEGTGEWPTTSFHPSSPELSSKEFPSERLAVRPDHTLSDYHPREVIYRERRPPRFPRALLLVALALLVIVGGTITSLVLTRTWRMPGSAGMTHKQRPKASAPAFSPTGKTPPPPTSIYDRWVQANGIMFGFDAQHSGFNPYERLLNTGNVSHLTLAWTSDPLGRNFFSSPVVSNGVVYVTTSTNQVFAIDVTTGHVRWSSSASPLASVSASGNFSTPAVVNGIVYVCLQDRHLYAFDALSGQLRWTTSGDEGELFSSPIVADGVVYITGGGGVDAFDAITGRHLWASATTEYLAQPVAVAHGMVYVGISDSSPSTGRVAALDARNGKVRWISDLIRGEGIDTNSSPTVENGLVYIGAGNGGIAAFDANTGHVLWVTPATKASTGSSPEVANGVVYITEDKVYAFNARTGAALWSSPPVGAYNDDSPTIANGVLYVGSAATNGTYIGSVYALDAATGKVLWASPPTSGQIFTTPAVANGVVYIASGDPDGKLYAFHLPS